LEVAYFFRPPGIPVVTALHIVQINTG